MKGILFKPDMIKAIIEGRKTVTRRTIKPQPSKEWDKVEPIKNGQGDIISWCFYKESDPDFHGYLKSNPRYRVGETVYVKEAWAYVSECNHFNHLHGDKVRVIYKVDGRCFPDKWHSPMFMPAWAARLFIKITANAPERLHKITAREAIKEGYPFGDIPSGRDAKQMAISVLQRIGWYQALWDSINPDYPFSSNPWVFRYEFEVLKESDAKE